MLYLSREQVFSLLTHEVCFEECEEALLLRTKGEADEVPRFRINLGPSEGAGMPLGLAIMPAVAPSRGVAGLRIFGGRPYRYMYILWDARDGTPLAMMDGQPVRDLRTAAIGAIGAKYLARPEARRVGILGSGTISRHGLLAHRLVLPLEYGMVYSPTKEHREAFAREMSEMAGMQIEPAASAEEAVRDAEVVMTGTSIRGPGGPVLKGDWLAPGTYVSGMGTRQELDDEVVRRASKVVIDSKPQFSGSSGDITNQVDKGIVSWEQVAALHDLVAGTRTGRENLDEITVLKTVGTPLQDLLPAARAYELALEKGIGLDLGDLFPPYISWFAEHGIR